MRFHVTGADKETGNDIEIDVTAADRAEAEVVASKRGVLVSVVQPIKEADPEPIELADIPLVDEKRAAPSTGLSAGTAAGIKAGTVVGQKLAGGTVAGASVVASHATAAGASTAGALGASGIAMASPGASQAPASGDTHAQASGGHNGHHATAHMEYHVIMNQSLYLLEVAVNKHIKDGWEPQGGLCVGISNNAMQYFQAVIRHRD